MQMYAERRKSLPLSPIMASPPNADDTGMNPGLSLGSGAPSTESQGTFYQKMEITFPQPVGNASPHATEEIVLD